MEQITGSVGRKTSDALLAKASNFGQMLEDVRKLALSKSLWDDEMQRDLPKKWEKHGDMIVFPQNTFTHINWRFIGRELWAVVAKSLNVLRIGKKRQIDEMRTPHVDLMFGQDAWVDYVDERGIRFSYDATKRVFDNSKKNEMKRISKWSCQGQVVVDMYSSLGYFSLTFLISCDAKQVVAIDWNEEILESLIRSSQVNHVDDRIVVLHGDCRRVFPSMVADRVYLGLLPSCRAHWLVACKALKAEGGIIHINEVVDMRELKKIKKVAKKEATSNQKEEKNKKIVRQKTMPALTSVNEEEKNEKNISDQKIGIEENGEGNLEGSEENSSNRKKFSRSASIVEEMENRVLPDVQIWKDYDGWLQLPDKHKQFALDCAQSCTRFLNNIHISDEMYCVTIVNVTRYGEVSKGKEHIVLDILCSPKNSSVEHLISKFTSENLKS